VATRESVNRVKEERKYTPYTPWLLLFFLLFTVGLIISSAFQKPSENPVLTKMTNQLTAENRLFLKQLNADDEKATPEQQNVQQDVQQNVQQNAPEQNLIGRLRAKIDLNLHATPERANNTIGTAGAGMVLSVKGKVDNWYQVVTPENTEGYITSNTKYIEILEMKE